MFNKAKIAKLLKASLIILGAIIGLLTASVTAKVSFDLTATNAVANPDTQINLNWTSVADSVYYKISRDNVVIKKIDVDTERNYLSYVDTGRLPETTYNYKVDAVNSKGEVVQTVSRSVVTASMKAPSIVSSCIDLNNKYVTLTWVNNSLAVDNTSVIKIGEGIIASSSTVGNSITFLDSSLTAGTKVQYALMSSDGMGHTSPYSSIVTLTPIELPTITASLVNKVNTISWDNNSNIEDFVLERSEYLENHWSSWSTIIDNIKPGSTSVKDTITNDGIFRYRLSINTKSFIGYSNISNPITRLFSPTNLECTPVGIGRIDLKWTNPSGSDYNLKVERKKSSDSSYTLLATLDSNISTYSDSNNIELNTGYYYRITAYISESNSAKSSECYIFTGPPDPARSLKADIISTNKVKLDWDDDSNNELGFIIERKINSGNFSQIATVSTNTTTYTDNTLSIDNIYTYRVIPYNPYGNAKSYTNELYISTSLIKDPPISLKAVPISASEIDLSWIYADSGNYSTAIERKMGSNGKWQLITTLPEGFTSFNDTKLSAGSQYYYRVKNVIDNNTYSRAYPENGVSASTKLMAPKELNAKWSSSDTIKLTWRGQSYGEKYFIVERKTDNGAYIKVATVSSDNGDYWFDSGLVSGKNYTYRIKSVSDDNSSDYSKEITVEGFTINPPSNLKATIVSEKEITLTWKDNSNNETSFKIEQKSSTSNYWYEIDSVIANRTSCTIGNLKSDKLYTFRVFAYNSTYNISSESVECEIAIIPLSPPSDLTVKTKSSSVISIEWTDNSTSEEGFIIERKSKDSDFKEIAKTDSNVTKFVDYNLQAEKEYYYRVRAFKGTSYTTYSNIVYTVTNIAKTFSDLNSVPWAKKAIENLAEWDIIKGKSSSQNIFAPNDKITRAEFISIVVTSLKFNGTPVGTFEDVKPEHWYYKNVMIAKNVGIVSGIGSNLFYPNEPIKREDMAVILARAMKISGNPLPNHDTSILDKYADKNAISDYAILSLSILNGEKIINGKSNTILAPKDYATRAEAAVMLYNILSQYFE
jgi:hypothetical protein